MKSYIIALGFIYLNSFGSQNSANKDFPLPYYMDKLKPISLKWNRQYWDEKYQSCEKEIRRHNNIINVLNAFSLNIFLFSNDECRRTKEVFERSKKELKSELKEAKKAIDRIAFEELKLSLAKE